MNAISALHDDTSTTSTGKTEEALLAALRAGKNDAFLEVVRTWSPGMLRVAQRHVPGHAVAEEVVQETWIAVLRGIDRFEGRSSLRTWVFRILINQAKTRGAAERRTVPFSDAFPDDGLERHEAVIPTRRVAPDDESEWPRRWVRPPARWELDGPEAALLAQETRVRLRAALAALPARQRQVVSLRDVQGYTGADVARELEVTEGNQRVLLHRGRGNLRAAIGEYLTAS
jgi:RNA polymerase sigma-70 factor (ECF subfamily)